MLHRAFAYVSRKIFKSIVIFCLLLLMASLSLIGLSVKEATARAAQESFKNITNSFSMQINRRVNPGTPRGAGNIKGVDIQKITENAAIDSYIKRINAIGDLKGYELIETSETKQNLTPERAQRFGSSMMVTGVNDSSKEDKFVSGAYQLVQGKHLTDGDKHQVLLHKDLASKYGWKVGDKVTLASNIYDADNEKGARETIEVTIKGLFDGHNKSAVTYSQELYENTAITDLKTAAQLYGNTEETAQYEDATFFVKADKNLDAVLQDLASIKGIDWGSYSLFKSSSNYPALDQSISGMYRMADLLFWGSLIFSLLLLSLLLSLWVNTRRKEVGIFLSIGLKPVTILGQFLTESSLLAVPAFIASYFVAQATAYQIGNHLLTSVTTDVAKVASKAAQASNLGGGAEVDGFSKTLSSLNISIQARDMGIVFLLGFFLLALVVSVTASPILRRAPKEILGDMS
ncbi:ABC transporter permease [Streptococcus sp. DD13]|uniref:ABC transporter permease n=1 Tax=Streptococcus sp. DD13 TaxID=1777881 RepID=UPI000794196A|nr:ABC transporter permease [Streptococcus sp. DD13]KXT79085.1 ABC transporter membrane-spanning permease, Pep export, Vex3 [Streptococcus sp. DD13]